MDQAEERGGNKLHQARSRRASVSCSRYPLHCLLLRRLPPCRTNNPVTAPGTLACLGQLKLMKKAPAGLGYWDGCSTWRDELIQK